MGLFNLFRTADINAGIEQFNASDGAVLLDVRTEEEYNGGHIENSVNIPLDRIFMIDKTVNDKAVPLYVYCYSGSRSGQAVSYLKRNGYTNVTNIGGISGYSGKVVS